MTSSTELGTEDRHLAQVPSPPSGQGLRAQPAHLSPFGPMKTSSKEDYLFPKD